MADEDALGERNHSQHELQYVADGAESWRTDIAKSDWLYGRCERSVSALARCPMGIHAYNGLGQQ